MNTTANEELLDRYLSGACSPEEQKQVEQWLDRQETGDNAWAQMDASAKAAWMASLYRDIRHTVAAGDEPNIIQAPVIPFYRRTLFRVSAAAMVLLLLGSGMYYWLGRQKPATTVAVRQPARDVAPGGNKAVLTLAGGEQIVLDSAANGLLTQQGGTGIHKQDGQIVYDRPRAADPGYQALVYNTMTTPRGGQYQLTLPDGTKVWLNAASSIHYPTAFAGKERRVSVTGEVYFEVAHTGNPFIVEINAASGKQAEVEVLGTHFNINAYDDEPAIHTTLLEGKVRISAGGTILLPGQQAQLSVAGGSPQVVSRVDTEQVMAWKNHLFKFDSVDLKKVMRQLARWYNIDVSYEGNAPVSEMFFGEMQRSLNLSQVLKGLGGMGVHFRIEGRRLIVTQ